MSQPLILVIYSFSKVWGMKETLWNVSVMSSKYTQPFIYLFFVNFFWGFKKCQCQVDVVIAAASFFPASRLPGWTESKPIRNASRLTARFITSSASYLMRCVMRPWRVRSRWQAKQCHMGQRLPQHQASQPKKINKKMQPGPLRQQRNSLCQCWVWEMDRGGYTRCVQ